MTHLAIGRRHRYFHPARNTEGPNGRSNRPIWPVASWEIRMTHLARQTGRRSGEVGECPLWLSRTKFGNVGECPLTGIYSRYILGGWVLTYPAYVGECPLTRPMWVSAHSRRVGGCPPTRSARSAGGQGRRRRADPLLRISESEPPMGPGGV